MRDADMLGHALPAHLDSIALDEHHFHGLGHTTPTALTEAGAIAFFILIFRCLI
jgi:hypothetical protein